MTTLAYLVLDLARDSLEMVLAGHPPPLLVAADGRAQYAEIQGSVVLGASQTSSYRAQTLAFRTGTMIVLYTDGLVERRGASIDDGLERLRALAAGAADTEAICTGVVDRLVAGQPADDVAVIAARLPPLAQELRTRWSAQPVALTGIRTMLRRWLTVHGASEDETYDILVASQEACANAVEHAFGPGHGHFDVDADHIDGRVRITVRDHGRWRPPRGAHRGRGLTLMRSLMDTVDIEHGDGGTVVVLERTISA